MPKGKNKFQDDEDINEVSQDDLTEDDLSVIRDSLIEVEESPSGNKKFITGIRLSPPPKKSWWDNAEKKFSGGNTLVPRNWDGENKRICRVCSPGTEVDTYLVKFYETRDEVLIRGKEYILAPPNTTFVPYMDEYTKWKYQQELKKKKT